MTNKIETQFHRFSLKFNKVKFENMFQLKAEYFNNKIFNSYIVGMYILCLLGILFCFFYQQYQGLIIKVMQLVTLLFCPKFCKKNGIKRLLLILFEHTSEIIFIDMVLNQYFIDNDDIKMQTIMGQFTGIVIAQETFIASICIRKWLMQFFFYIITIFLSAVQDKLDFYVYLIMPALFLGSWIAFYFYNYEKNEKLQFLRDYYQSKNEQKWKNLIDKQIPSGFIVLQAMNNQFQISFFNQICISYFSKQNEIDLLYQLQFITIRQIEQINTNVLEQDREIYKNTNLNYYINQQGPDIINNQKQIHLINCQYQTEQTQDIKYFDIVLIGCKWNNQKSLVITISDISEKLRLQKQKEIDNYKDQLLATITHDLKTPLNGMILILQTAKSLIVNNDKITKYLDIVLCNCFLLLHLINDILDFTRIQLGELKLIYSQFSIDDVLQDIKDLVFFQANQKKIVIEVINKNIKSQLINDQNRLKQILLNLVSNALKFTFQGTIKVIVEQISQDLIQISVEDTGVGIPQELIPKLFKFFGTFDHANGSNQHGVGLGLVICKKLVEQLGPQQQINIVTEINKGSTFKFLIYKEIIADQQNIKKQRKISEIFSQKMNLFSQSIGSEKFISQQKIMRDSIVEINQYEQNKKEKQINESEIDIEQINLTEHNKVEYQVQQIKELQPKFMDQLKQKPITQQFQEFFPIKTRILIVDDTPFNILGLKIFLEPIQNLYIDEAYNGLEAIDKVAQSIQTQFVYSLIFMDVNMPVMDGIQAINLIRKNYNEQKINIISFTAYNEEQDQLKCLEAGADAVMTKPITNDALFEILKKVYN